MKKNYFILSLLLFTAPFCAQSQVVNGDFENVKPNFLPSNWGMNFFQQFGIDLETGEQIGDQIQFTWCVPSMVYATTEAKDGQYAMEISNAYNATQDKVIPGFVSIFSDPAEDIPGWNPGIPVEPGTSVVLLGFDYKFLPVGSDVAEAKLNVFDSEGNEIGKTALTISGTHNTYEYIYAPIEVIQSGTPAYMYISFNMAKADSTPTFGTRLIIDNVKVNLGTLIIEENSQAIKVFPTLVDNELNVIPTGFAENVSYKIINSEGRVVKQNTVNQDSDYVYTMDVSQLSSGVYFLNIQDGAKNSTKKFIKK